MKQKALAVIDILKQQIAITFESIYSQSGWRWTADRGENRLGLILSEYVKKSFAKRLSHRVFYAEISHRIIIFIGKLHLRRSCMCAEYSVNKS